VLPSSILENPEFDTTIHLGADDLVKRVAEMEELDIKIAMAMDAKEDMDKKREEGTQYESTGSSDGPNAPQNQGNQNLPSLYLIDQVALERNEHGRRRSVNSPSSTLPFPNEAVRSPYPMGAPSPSMHSEASSRSALSPQSGITGQFLYPRRPSESPENAPPLPSGSMIGSSNWSTDGNSPSSQPSPKSGDESDDSLSITGAMRETPILPPPIPSMQPLTIHTIPAHGTRGFQCDYSGCTARPFQTQYLLKWVMFLFCLHIPRLTMISSHMNVHVQHRPYHCPVPGCPRSEGGKGFKRKNEMIRHGLVHDLPGYICPFCPDRDHKYPRPDNLERHVRVHHLDKSKNDPLLRDVLAQRLEVRGSGGRRKVGDEFTGHGQLYVPRLHTTPEPRQKITKAGNLRNTYDSNLGIKPPQTTPPWRPFQPQVRQETRPAETQSIEVSPSVLKRAATTSAANHLPDQRNVSEEVPGYLQNSLSQLARTIPIDSQPIEKRLVNSGKIEDPALTSVNATKFNAESPPPLTHSTSTRKKRQGEEQHPIHSNSDDVIRPSVEGKTESGWERNDHPKLNSTRPQRKRAVKSQKRAEKFAVLRNRRGLPITFDHPESPATVMSCPDTGSEVNAISFELARLLHLDVDFDVDSHSMATTLANGKPHFAVGIAMVDCILDSATNDAPPNFWSTFYVFYELVEPCIYVGRGFLQLTETLSKYSERLLPRCPMIHNAPLVRSIGRQHEVLECCVNGVEVQAAADTGAEVNLMSRRFAEECNFVVQDGSIRIQYADGSYAQSNGFIVAEVAVGFDTPTYADLVMDSMDAKPKTDSDPKQQDSTSINPAELAPTINIEHVEDVRRVVTITFHLTRDLFTEVLIGDDALAVLQPHRLNPENFTWSSDGRSQYPYMNRITEVQRPSKLRRLATAMGFAGK
jgi:hypothetical protein